MSNLKFLVFAYLMGMSFSAGFSQNLQKPSSSEIEKAPQWAKFMYSENPSIFEVDQLYREFYRNNPFENRLRNSIFQLS